MSPASFTTHDYTFTVLPLGPLEENTILLQPSGQKQVWLFDPGSDAPAVQAYLKQHHLTPTALWHTHGHFDHMGGSAFFPSTLPGYLAQEDLVLYAQVERYAVMFKMAVKYDPQRCWQDLPAGASFTNDFTAAPTLVAAETPNANSFMQVLATPGHTPGGRCFYFKDLGVLISGDTLFAGAVGRTDLPGGNWEQLQASLRSKILALPDPTIILPGHGPQTTLAAEKNANPYLQDLI